MRIFCILWFLKMALETMKELFGVTHIGEVEVPNAKRIRVQEEEVSLSQPVTAIVPPEEEEVPVPLEEDEVLVPQAPPPIMVPPDEGEAMRTRGLIVTMRS
jgi:hypothetical protein